MKRFQNILTVTGICLSMTTASFAAPITGSINFNSQFTSTVADLTQAGTINIIAPTTVNTVGVAAPTGSFTGLSGTATTNSSFGINGAGNAVTIAPSTTLWSVGGFSFVSGSIFEEANTSSIIAIKSFGTLSGNNFDPTPGVYTATFQLNGQTLSSSFSAGASAVPDGGSTAALLGLSLLGLVGFAKRKA